MASKKKTVGTGKKVATKKADKPAKSKGVKTLAKREPIAASKSKKKTEVAPPALAKKKVAHSDKKNKERIVKKAIVKKTKEAPVKKTGKGSVAKGKTTVKKETVNKSSNKVKVLAIHTEKATTIQKGGSQKKPKVEALSEKIHNNHTPVVARPMTRKETVSTKSTGKPKFIYKPEPSILDNPPENNGPRKRYSDNDLQEFKDLIQRKLESAKKELVYLQGLITRRDEAGTDDTENKYMGVEDGSGTMEREQLSQLASRQIQYIDHLEKALVRIENKTYGICRVTGKLIDKARLRAVPHATLSIEAKLSNKR
ncbi:MAG: TraR/DksA C4-type zinc finger protein [Chitinophagaceae bacterium]